MTTVIKDMVTWLKQWFYDEDEIDTKLSNKANKNLGTANYNVVTDSSGDITVEAKPTIPSASSTTPSADVSGGAIGSGTTWAKADHQHPLSSAYATSGHSHYINNSTSDNGSLFIYPNGNGQNPAHLGAWLKSLETTVDSFANINFIEITTNKGTASASTMNKLYIETKNNKTDVYYTVRSGTDPNYTYAWEDLDTDILDNLVVDWSDVQNKPSFGTGASDFATGNHVHGAISNDGKVGSNANYFLYTSTGGAVASKQKIGNITTDGKIGTTSGYVVKTGTGGTLTASTLIDMDLHMSDAQGSPTSTTLKEAYDLKADASDLTSKSDKTATLGTTITLVDKGETNEGCIIFNTIS